MLRRALGGVEKSCLAQEVPYASVPPWDLGGDTPAVAWRQAAPFPGRFTLPTVQIGKQDQDPSPLPDPRWLLWREEVRKPASWGGV